MTTSTETNPTFLYSDCGIYIVSLTSDLTNGQTATIRKRVVISTTIGFTNMDSDYSFTFDPCDECITSYLWHFGDGGTSTDQNPDHTYVTADDYSVSLDLVYCDAHTETITLPPLGAIGVGVQCYEWSFAGGADGWSICTTGSHNGSGYFEDGASTPPAYVLDMSISFGSDALPIEHVEIDVLDGNFHWTLFVLDSGTDICTDLVVNIDGTTPPDTIGSHPAGPNVIDSGIYGGGTSTITEDFTSRDVHGIRFVTRSAFGAGGTKITAIRVSSSDLGSASLTSNC